MGSAKKIGYCLTGAEHFRGVGARFGWPDDACFNEEYSVVRPATSPDHADIPKNFLMIEIPEQNSQQKLRLKRQVSGDILKYICLKINNLV